MAGERGKFPILRCDRCSKVWPGYPDENSCPVCGWRGVSLYQPGTGRFAPGTTKKDWYGG